MKEDTAPQPVRERPRPGGLRSLRLSNLLIPQKLALIISIFFCIMVLMFFMSAFGLSVLSDVRAYVAGEGLWSKSQKDAVYCLMRYAIFHDERDYLKYQNHLKVPLGDRQARLELEKEETDFNRVDAGFIEGRNHPLDVRGMGRLFKNFYFISYIRDAVRAWQDADVLFDELLRLGDEVHSQVLSGRVTEADTSRLLARIEEVNNKLTPLEDLFSYRLGEGARWLRGILLAAMLTAAGVLLTAGVLLAMAIARHLIAEIYRLRGAAAKIAEGNYAEPIDVASMDEVGDLARSFQQMAAQRERAERIKDEFFATVSHELRTPLTLVLTPLESLLMNDYGELPAPQRKILETMHNNAIRLLQMVTGLLDFSKFEAGRIEVKREATDLLAVTQSVLEDFRAMITHKKIKSSLAAEPSVISVEMDRYLYERILFNLLSNAVKFTPEGGIVSVSLKWHENRVHLSVNDTGIGISSEDQLKLFEKFRQLEGAATRRFEGTGLGLALVKEFAALLGGTVRVESEAGKGSTFTVEVDAPPALRGSEVPAEMRHRRLAQQYRIEDELAGESSAGAAELPRLLIAEDNFELASYLAAQLKDIASVRIVRDGEDALREVFLWFPDMVLSDVMMPRRDGLSLCRAIKENPKTAHIPVVILTALTHRDALLKGWEAGADEYLFKPFHPTELVTRVKSVLANARQRRNAELALLESRDQLEAKVRERTAELLEANRTLLKQKSDLEKVNLELDSFVYSASHDLRAPLRSIASFSDVFKERYAGQLDEQGKDYLTRIEKGAVRMNQLIDDLLSVSRLTRIRNPYERVSVKELLDSVLQTIEFDIRESGVVVDFPPDLPVIFCDRVKLSEVFQNLINNAIKFSRARNAQGALRVEIGYTPHATEFEFVVRDYGIGIDPQFQDRIFDIFWQLNPSQTSKGGGVGLSIVKRVIQQHGGRIWVESRLGEGAAFHFTVPRDPLNSEQSLKHTGT